ncbi:plasmid mobilization protein [Mucilaginibacter sp.]
MGRVRYKKEDELLNHPIIIRVNEAVYNRLEKLQTDSNCQSIGEVARKILSREKILVFHKDISMNGTMEELTSIRKELKAIGVNINQLTKSFNGAATEAQRNFYVVKTAVLYKEVDAKVERLLVMVSQLTQKWLQR